MKISIVHGITRILMAKSNFAPSLIYTEHVHSSNCICCALASFGTSYQFDIFQCKNVPDKGKKRSENVFILDNFHTLDINRITLMCVRIQKM